MSFRPLSNLLLTLVLCCAALPAWAQPTAAEKESLEHWKKGGTYYDLGRFSDAIEEFQKAYELKADPTYLFNIAQAYRQADDAQKAVYFYKRYLSKSPNASNRALVEKRIAEQEEVAKKQAEARAKPPDPPPDDKKANNNGGNDSSGTSTGSGGGNGATTTTDSPPDEVVAAASPHPTRVRFVFEGGAAFMSFGSAYDSPVQLVLRLGGAYTLHAGAHTEIDLGISGALTPVPFNTRDTPPQSGTSTMVGAFGTVTGRQILGRVAIELGAGGGIVAWTGLGNSNIFTSGTASTVIMPTFRVWAALDVTLAGGLFLTVGPAFSYSLSGSDLDPRIERVTSFQVLGGLGYTL
jgi:hypothetical protein